MNWFPRDAVRSSVCGAGPKVIENGLLKKERVPVQCQRSPRSARTHLSQHVRLGNCPQVFSERVPAVAPKFSRSAGLAFLSVGCPSKQNPRRRDMKLHKTETAQILIAGLPCDIDKWSVLRKLERCGPSCGLSVQDLDFLRLLIRLTRPEDWTAGNRPTIYASNQVLAERIAKTERTVQRRLSTLLDQGLMAKVGPAHSRRYARRNARGETVVLSGFDLSPLAHWYLRQPDSSEVEDAKSDRFDGHVGQVCRSQRVSDDPSESLSYKRSFAGDADISVSAAGKQARYG